MNQTAADPPSAPCLTADTRRRRQIRTLKEQLSQEIRTRQQYILRTTRAGEEIREIRSSLDQSLRNVSANEGGKDDGFGFG